jgi:hypothetical protein
MLKQEDTISFSFDEKTQCTLKRMIILFLGVNDKDRLSFPKNTKKELFTLKKDEQ